MSEYNPETTKRGTTSRQEQSPQSSTDRRAAAAQKVGKIAVKGQTKNK